MGATTSSEAEPAVDAEAAVDGAAPVVAEEAVEEQLEPEPEEVRE